MILQEAQQNAWLTLADKKNTVVQELTNKELELQSLSDFTLFKKKYKEWGQDLRAGKMSNCFRPTIANDQCL